MKLNEVINEFIAGSFAGLASLVVGHPLDTIKTIAQNSNEKTKISDIVRKVRQTGLASFFRGLSLPFYSYAMVNAVLFTTYKSALTVVDPTQSSYMAMGLAGFIAGGVQLIPAIPVEVVKICLQKEAVNKSTKKTGVLMTMDKLIKERGVRSLYSGCLAQASRDMPACAIYFTSYSFARDILYRQYHFGSLSSSFWAGALGGCLSWAITIPQDVIKTRMQAGSEKGLIECVKALSRGGYSAFFRGFQMVFLRAFVVNAFTFLAYEFVINELQSNDSPNEKKRSKQSPPRPSNKKTD